MLRTRNRKAGNDDNNSNNSSKNKAATTFQMKKEHILCHTFSHNKFQHSNGNDNERVRVDGVVSPENSGLYVQNSKLRTRIDWTMSYHSNTKVFINYRQKKRANFRLHKDQNSQCVHNFTNNFVVFFFVCRKKLKFDCVIKNKKYSLEIQTTNFEPKMYNYIVVTKSIITSTFSRRNKNPPNKTLAKCHAKPTHSGTCIWFVYLKKNEIDKIHTWRRFRAYDQDDW